VVGKELTKKQQKYEAKPDLGKNCMIENQEFPPQSDRGMGRKLL